MSRFRIVSIGVFIAALLVVINSDAQDRVTIGGGSGSGGTPSSTLTALFVGTFVEAETCPANTQEVDGTLIAGGVGLHPEVGIKNPTWVSGGDLQLPNWQGLFTRNLGAQGVYVAGTPSGVQDDATAPNALSVDDVQIQTFRVGIAGGPNAAWFADGGTGTEQSYTVTGDTETRPGNYALRKCVILEI